ncbi:uncharacterized protein RAG0_11597 [Rhynchosporium agropyri]|uniref:Uncharacterized protein n=1 Tax=Rhynchosporium agropyri TaxID=914238 RepID=A0A1E1L4W4_9HELO|nr:uncharacterized protein RAG0_11597 [Rhynchosporium agropyri]
MAVTYWRSQPPDSISYQNDGTTPEPSSTVRVRRRSRDAIPPGSVAARIKLLQSFKLPLPGESGALTSRRAREDSLSGYGRRLIQRFGNPAFQSAQPDQDTQIEDKHSYLGLNIARSKLEEEYDLSDSLTRYSRSPGINGQIDRRTDTRTRYDAVSLRGALSRMESLLPASLRDHSPDLDVLKEIDSPGNQSQDVSPISIFPSSAKKHNAGMFSGQIKTCRSRFTDSEATIATTSTMRRQNVRDLFDDFGIQRPAGLASREVSRYISEPTYSTEQQTLCHLCSWSSSQDSIKCWRCNHRFCVQCKAHASQLPTNERNLAYGIQNKQQPGFQKIVSKPKENRVEHDPMKHLTRPCRTQIQYAIMRKPSSSPIMFPDSQDPPIPQKSPIKTHSVQQEGQAHGPVHVPSGHKTATSVKESPFLIADLKSRHSLQLFPVNMRVETHHIAHNHHSRHSERQGLLDYTSTIPSENLSCDSHVSRVTYRSEPSHNTSAFPRRKPRHRVPACTDDGYVADTSLAEEAVDIQSCCNSQLSKHYPCTAQPSGSGYSHATCTASGLDSAPSHGASHGRKRDFVATHDIPDVRCCTHTDHQTIVHHHHKPRKVTLEFPEEHDPLNTEKTLITGHKSQSVQPHSSKVHHQHELDPNVKREHASEMLAQSRDPPKPPPLPQMVSNRKKEDIKSARHFDESRKTKVEKIKEVTEPPPKEYTPSSQRTLAEHPTFAASAKPTNGISYMIPSSEYDHDQIHSRRSSSSPSRKHPVDGPSRIAEIPSSVSPQTQTSHPGSEASRKLELPSFIKEKRKERNQSSVKLLKHRLLSHREDLQKIQPNCTEQINLPRHSGVAEIAQKLRRTSNPQAEYCPYAKRTSGISSRGGGRSKQKRIRKLKLKIVDWTPEGRKKAGEEHCLSDDDAVSEIESYRPGQRVTTAGAEGDFDWADDSRVEQGSEYRLSVDEVVLDQMVTDSGRFHELRSESEYEPNLSVDIAARKLERECERERESVHDCVWKMRFEELRRKTRDGDGDGDAGLGIMGVTVLVHLKGREDLIATAESWTGGQLKV